MLFSTGMCTIDTKSGVWHYIYAQHALLVLSSPIAVMSAGYRKWARVLSRVRGHLGVCVVNSAYMRLWFRLGLYLEMSGQLCSILEFHTVIGRHAAIVQLPSKDGDLELWCSIITAASSGVILFPSVQGSCGFQQSVSCPLPLVPVVRSNDRLQGGSRIALLLGSVAVRYRGRCGAAAAAGGPFTRRREATSALRRRRPPGVADPLRCGRGGVARGP